MFEFKVEKKKKKAKIKRDNGLQAESHMLPLWTGVSFPGERWRNEKMAPEAEMSQADISGRLHLCVKVPGTQEED